MFAVMSDQAAAPLFVLSRLVEMADVDAAGILHFSRFLIFAEAAETAFLRDCGWPVFQDEGDAIVGLPRVHADIDYRAPAYLGRVVEVAILSVQLGARSLTTRFRVSDPAAALTLAEGTLVSAFARLTRGGGASSLPIPDELRRLLSRKA